MPAQHPTEPAGELAGPLPQPEADDPFFYHPASSSPHLGGGVLWRDVVLQINSDLPAPTEVCRIPYFPTGNFPPAYYSAMTEAQSAVVAKEQHSAAVTALSLGNIEQAAKLFDQSRTQASNATRLWAQEVGESNESVPTRIARFAGKAVVWTDSEGTPKYMTADRQLDHYSTVGRNIVTLEEVIAKNGVNIAFRPSRNKAKAVKPLKLARATTPSPYDMLITQTHTSVLAA